MLAKIIKQVDDNYDEYYEKFVGTFANVLSIDDENDEYWLDIPNKFGYPESNWCRAELEIIEG